MLISEMFYVCLAYIFKYAALPSNQETKSTINLEGFRLLFFMPDACCCAATITIMMWYRHPPIHPLRLICEMIFHCAFAVATTLAVWSTA